MKIVKVGSIKEEIVISIVISMKLSFQERFNATKAFCFISAPCKVVKYDSDKFQMIQNPQDIWRERNKTNQTSFTRYITMYYSSSDVATLTEEKLIDFSNFVSAVGGNLGLFLGFSFLGLLSSLYEYIETLLSSRQKDNDENNEMML